MTKKQTSTPEKVRSDYGLVQVTLTLAVETWLCDEHSDLVHESVIETVLDKFATIGDGELIVLHSEFTPLTLTKAVQS